MPDQMGQLGRRRSSNASNNPLAYGLKSFSPAGFTPDRMPKGRRQSMFSRSNLLSAVKQRNIHLLLKFRRKAKLVRILCRVFAICNKDLNKTSSEDNWMALKEKLLRESNYVLQQHNLKNKNDENQKVRLNNATFDVKKFRKQPKSSVSLFPASAVELFSKSPHLRTDEENDQILRTMQKFDLFSRYPVLIQQSFAANGWLEQHQADKIVLMKNHPANCIYFVLSGRLVANSKDSNGNLATGVLKKGDKFGERDVVAMETRTSTVVCQDFTTLFAVHKKDYRKILREVATSDSTSLNKCKNLPVFYHWPFDKLQENLYSWNVQNYKEGSLICRDSNNSDWLFIVQSGSCKVVKSLPLTDAYYEYEEEQFEEDLRRMRHHQFIERISTPNSRQQLRRPASSAKTQRSNQQLTMSNYFTPHTNDHIGERPVSSRPMTSHTNRPMTSKTRVTSQSSRPVTRMTNFTNMTSQSYSSKSFVTSLYGGKPELFVALGVLQEGDGFGFRSLLPRQDRGESVCLVSSGCEIIRINKKFFKQHCDETTQSLIKMKVLLHKVFLLKFKVLYSKNFPTTRAAEKF